MPAIDKDYVNEGNNYDLTFSVPESTDGETVSARMRATDGSGTGTSVGSTSGDVADTQLTIQLGISGFSPDEYYLEVYADYGGGNQRIVYPDPDTTKVIEVVDRFGVSN